MNCEKKMLSAPIIALLTLIGGCGLVIGAVGLVVGTASIAGYSVYKGGEAIVDAVIPGDKSEESDSDKSVVFSSGTFKIKNKHNVKDLHTASIKVLKDSGFKITKNNCDDLNAIIIGETSTQKSVLIKLELISKTLTAVEVKIGSGNLKQSQYIYNKINSELSSIKEVVVNEKSKK